MIAFDTIKDVSERLRRRELTSVDLTRLMLDRIDRYNTTLNAFITVTADAALADAAAADNAFQKGIDNGALQGIPIALKDLIDTNGVRTTGGSGLFAQRIPDSDATVVSKLKAAGAVILGKTGMHELAYGTTSENVFFGDVRNPWSQAHFAGGSSGGSAAAVAAGLSYAAIGTDTGCSIRQPAHCCGIVGLKPTFGLVSKAGVMPLCWTMDHVGPMTRSVEDAALMLKAIAGFDWADPYSLNVSFDATGSAPPIAIDGLRVGVMREYFFDGDDAVVCVVDAALEQLTAAGACIVDIEIPDVALASRTSRVVFAEALAIHERNLDDHPDLFGDEVRGKLIANRSITAAEYAEAQHFRLTFTQQFERVFDECDVVCSPTALSTAVSIHDPASGHASKAWQNTIISDFTGHPSVSVPCGLSANGLPVGLMLTGALVSDQRLLLIAQEVERVLSINMQPPNFG
ncbi:MAG: amidase [Pseudomonadota bacterium]